MRNGAERLGGGMYGGTGGAGVGRGPVPVGWKWSGKLLTDREFSAIRVSWGLG